MSYKVIVTEPAENDLRGIVRYIKVELLAPDAAVNIYRAIRQGILSLCDLPKRNPLVRDKFLASFGYRLAIVKNYNIIYLVDEEADIVSIERILYKSRDWNNLLNS